MKSCHTLLLSLTTIALWVFASKGQDDLCDYNDDIIMIKQACFPDKKGYHNCQGGSSIQATVCESGSECLCHVDSWDEQVCRCEIATPRPDFPATGVIRWNGKEEYDAFLLFLTIALWVFSSQGQDKLCDRNDDYVYIKQACFPDKKGYHTCQGGNSFRATVCEAGLECRCHVDWWDEQVCKCENATPRPDFPATGVIRWTGKEEYDNDYRWDRYEAGKYIFKHHNLRVAKLSGEVHLDANGRYLHKETKVASSGWKRQEGNKDPATMTTTVLMVIPNADGTFTRYEKQDNKECKKTTMQNAELSLTSIWMKKPPRGLDGYFKIVGRSKNNEIVETQKWNMFVEGDGYHESWTWFVNYDKQKHHAIPIKQIYAPGSKEYSRKEFYYNYQPLKEGETSFDVTDFCSYDIP